MHRTTPKRSHSITDVCFEINQGHEPVEIHRNIVLELIVFIVPLSIGAYFRLWFIGPDDLCIDVS